MKEKEEIGRCDCCHRCTWEVEEIEKECNFPQPDGSRCIGQFVLLKD